MDVAYCGAWTRLIPTGWQELALAEKQRALAEKEEMLAAELERRKLEKLRDERMIEKARPSRRPLSAPCRLVPFVADQSSKAATRARPPRGAPLRTRSDPRPFRPSCSSPPPEPMPRPRPAGVPRRAAVRGVTGGAALTGRSARRRRSSASWSRSCALPT